jgi:cytochrome P450
MEGYQKYPGQAFKIPLVDSWQVVISGNDMVEDLKKANEMDLSFLDAVAESLQSDYTLGPAARVDPYHVDVIRSPLTRNLGARFHDIRDEIEAAFADEIPAKESEWMQVPMLYTAMKIISRTSNRLFVGLPLCRNPDYMHLNIEFTVDAAKGARVLRRYPAIFRPIVARFLTDVASCNRRGNEHLEPLIKERLQKEKEYETSDWPGKPNDLISWLLDEAKGDRRANIIPNIVSRILLTNFAAIHTTSISFTNTMFYLAANPALAEPLREETQSVVNALGWTKAAMGKMWKLDSFLKETQRLTGLSTLGMNRMALKDFTFSNGTVVPAGTIVSAWAYGLHHDDAIYKEAETMDPFRFSDMRAQEGESIKHQMVAANDSYALFGTGGRHMCPGRFFAVNELKALLAHVLVTYDVKFENDGGFPASHWDGATCSPNHSARVLFRKRVV